jgi:hypothetical protein
VWVAWLRWRCMLYDLTAPMQLVCLSGSPVLLSGATQ